MAKKISLTKINKWIDGYQYLTLLYFLSKTQSLEIIHLKKPNNLLSISRKINTDVEIILRIFLALQSIGMCRIKNENILITKAGQNFLECNNESLALKSIISFERWLPCFLNVSRLFDPKNKSLNKDSDHIQNTLQLWFAAESKLQAKYIVPKLPLNNITTVADIGGGSGSLLTQILKSKKNITGSLYDKIFINQNHDFELDKFDIQKRLMRYKCDFFKKFKINAEAILLKSVLHNWNDIDAIKILKNIHLSMPINSKIFVIERIYDQTKNIKNIEETALLDLRMMFVHGGKERSVNEYKLLLESSGFEFEKKIKTLGSFFILQAKKKSILKK